MAYNLNQVTFQKPESINSNFFLVDEKQTDYHKILIVSFFNCSLSLPLPHSCAISRLILQPQSQSQSLCSFCNVVTISSVVLLRFTSRRKVIVPIIIFIFCIFLCCNINRFMIHPNILFCLLIFIIIFRRLQNATSRINTAFFVAKLK